MPEPGHHHRGVDPRSDSPGARITRRHALGIGGLFGLAGVIAACGSSSSDAQAGASTTDNAAGGSAGGSVAAGSADAQLATLLDQAPRCVLTKEETQGPYWFDVDSIRDDVRDDRTGLPLRLALRVQNLAQCTDDPAAGGVQNAVVEIWHCDAMGVYSGFRNGFGSGPGAGGPGAGGPAGPPPGGQPPSGAPGGPPPGGQPPSGAPGTPPEGAPAGAPAFDSGGAPATGPVSDGSYSEGDVESTPSGTATFLRGAQATDAQGIVHFTSIFPGWYTGRAVHIHIKVHIDKKTVLTTQLFFDDTLTDDIYASTTPYSQRGARDTRNDADTIYDATGLSAAQRTGDGVIAALNLGVQV